jgi:hypothetical protein
MCSAVFLLAIAASRQAYPWSFYWQGFPTLAVMSLVPALLFALFRSMPWYLAVAGGAGMTLAAAIAFMIAVI